jgi:hypothetical protein
VTAFSQCPQVMPLTSKIWFMMMVLLFLCHRGLDPQSMDPGSGLPPDLIRGPG